MGTKLTVTIDLEDAVNDERVKAGDLAELLCSDLAWARASLTGEQQEQLAELVAYCGLADHARKEAARAWRAALEDAANKFDGTTAYNPTAADGYANAVDIASELRYMATETPNDLGNRRDAGPIGGASGLTDELCGNGSEVGAGDTAMKGKQ